MRSSSETTWYYVLLLMASLLGSVAISRLTGSVMWCLTYGIFLGIFWSGIWKKTIGKLFNEKEK